MTLNKLFELFLWFILQFFCVLFALITLLIDLFYNIELNYNKSEYKINLTKIRRNDI